jgi:hypothetical protein
VRGKYFTHLSSLGKKDKIHHILVTTFKKFTEEGKK